MQIQKRSGQAEAFDGGKILAAMEKSFASVGQAPSVEQLLSLIHI